MLRFLIAAVFAAVCSISYAQNLPTPNVAGLKVNGTAQSFPASGSIAGTSDTQTLTNKAINSGMLARSVSYTDAIKCDGVTDDTAAIQNAINALPATGGDILLPVTGHPCLISNTIEIGNGNASLPSSKNSIGLIGIGLGGAPNEFGGQQSTVLKWTGASGGTAIQVNGPVSGLNFKNITIDCNSLCATGFNLVYPIESNFSRLSVISQTGTAYILTALPNATIATGAFSNIFSDVGAPFPIEGSGGSCFQIGAHSTGGDTSHDVVRNIFIRIECGYDASVSSSFGIDYAFADNNQFVGISAIGFHGSLGVGFKVDPPTGTTGFPNDTSIFGSAVSFSSPNNASVWAAATGINFYGYSTGDGEATPSGMDVTSGRVTGVTTGGKQFGMTFTNGVTCAGSPTSSFAAVSGVVTHC